MIFALVGNQNCGKTTLFNALTGSNQHVGNFPGVTVDQKTGEIRGEKGCSVVDLPGIYSLRPYTQEEIVSRDYILQQKPDGIINIVDANGGTVDVQKMSRALGIPVVPISAAKGEGVSELVDQALSVARGHVLPKVTDFCADDSAVHRCIHAVVHLIADHADRMGVPARFWPWTRTNGSCWSTASSRWRRKRAWTATPPWRTCGTPSLKTWWTPRWSSATKAGSMPGPCGWTVC